MGDPCGNIIEEAVNPYAFIILENEIRDTAKETFGYFASQGVDIVVISGDNPVTASKVAVRAGINNAENYIDATTLKSRQDIREAITKYTVFGRVTIICQSFHSVNMVFIIVIQRIINIKNYSFYHFILPL